MDRHHPAATVAMRSSSKNLQGSSRSRQYAGGALRCPIQRSGGCRLPKAAFRHRPNFSTTIGTTTSPTTAIAFFAAVSGSSPCPSVPRRSAALGNSVMPAQSRKRHGYLFQAFTTVPPTPTWPLQVSEGQVAAHRRQPHQALERLTRTAECIRSGPSNLRWR